MTEAYYDRLRTLATLQREYWESENSIISFRWWPQLALMEGYEAAGIKIDKMCGSEYVAHYTSVDAIFDFFTKNEKCHLMASVLEDLNDIDELNHGYELWKSEVGEATPKDHSEFVTMSSFSEKIDDANMWISYGKGGYGACIEVSRYHLFSLQECFAGPIIYEKEKQGLFTCKIAEWVQVFRKKRGFEDLVARIPSVVSALMKDKQFEFEAEYRIIGRKPVKGIRLGSRIRAAHPVNLMESVPPTAGFNYPNFGTSDPRRLAFNQDAPESHFNKSVRIRLGPAAKGVRRAFELAMPGISVLDSERRLR